MSAPDDFALPRGLCARLSRGRAGSRPDAEAPQGSSPEKRRQILNGAREVFLARGFDGASMGEIARAAGVSKGTLYLYFPSKEALLGAFVRVASEDVAERCFVLDVEADVGEVLTQVGHRYVAAMVRPEHIATVRMVLGIAEKLPEIGRSYLAAGQGAAVERLSAWLEAKIDRGELVIADVELAAWQFIIGCHALVVMPLLFGGPQEPDPDQIERVVNHTVASFLGAFAPRR